MSEICIHIPPLAEKQTIELEVTANGKKRMMNYRVESFAWPMEAPAEERIEQLKHYISSYEDGWELVQIGPSNDGLVPVMFRQQQ